MLGEDLEDLYVIVFADAFGYFFWSSVQVRELGLDGYTGVLQQDRAVYTFILLTTS